MCHPCALRHMFMSTIHQYPCPKFGTSCPCVPLLLCWQNSPDHTYFLKKITLNSVAPSTLLISEEQLLHWFQSNWLSVQLLALQKLADLNTFWYLCDIYVTTYLNIVQSRLRWSKHLGESSHLVRFQGLHWPKFMRCESCNIRCFGIRCTNVHNHWQLTSYISFAICIHLAENKCLNWKADISFIECCGTKNYMREIKDSTRGSNSQTELVTFINLHKCKKKYVTNSSPL